MNQKGATLVEALVASLMIALAAVGVLSAFNVMVRANSRSEIRAGAVAAAEQMVETIRIDDPELLPTSGTRGPETIEIGGRAYQALAHYCTEAAYCQVNSRQLEVEVQYDGRKIYTVQTVFTQMR